MHRRTYLGAGTGLALVAAAGCLTDALGSGDDGETVLGPPADEHAGGDFVYPTHGEAFPTFELEDPLAGTTVDSTPAGDCLVCTAFYAYCPAECVPLMHSLSDVHETVLDRGVDDVRFLAITFDPERDTPDALSEHAEMLDIDAEADTWHYLRPADADEAEAIVNDELGVIYEREPVADEYEFEHVTVTTLVNPGGIVERTYLEDALDVEQVVDDVVAVADGWE